MSLRKNITGTIGVNLLSFFLSFINGILSTRILGPEGKGQFAIYLATISLFTLFLGLGLPTSITYYVSKKKYDLSRIASTFILFAVIATTAFFLILRILYLSGDKGVFLPGEYDILKYQLLISGNFLVQLIFVFMSAIMSGKILFRRINQVALFTAILTVAIYLTLFILNKSGTLAITVTHIFISNLAIVSAGLILLTIYYYKAGGQIASAFLPFKEVASFFLFGGIIFIANLAQFLNYRLDYWIVGHYQTDTQLGLYVLASSLGQMIWILPNSIATVLFPYISTSQGQNTAETTKTITRVVFFVCIILGLLLAVSANLFIPLLYGKAFLYSAKVLLILLLGIIPACALAIISPYFSGHNKIKINMYGSLIGLLITVCLDFLLIPKIGIDGAAIASAISYSATTVFAIVIFIKLTKSRLKDILVIKRSDIVFAISHLRAFFIKS